MKYLNVKELAARWRISTKTLERWRCEGIGPVYMKLHGKILYALTEVERHEQTRTRIATDRASPHSGLAPDHQ